MEKLIKFELSRMKYKRLLIFVPLIIIGIGFIGIVTGSAFGDDMTNKMKMLNLYQAYTQFIFIFLGCVYAYIFTEDFSKGVNNYLNQVGYSLLKQIVAKMLILFILSSIVVLTFTLVYAMYIDLNDRQYQVLMVLSMIFGILFTLLFSCVLSIILQKVLIATVVQFVFFIIFDVLNIYVYGLANPCDANSLSTMTFRHLSGINITHKSLETLNINYDLHPALYIFGPSVVYVVLLIIITLFLIFYKERKKYGKQI